MKYTPGPWKVAFGTLPGDSGFSIASDNSLAENVKITAECWPCTIVSEEHRKEIFANAKLIAAAPDLLGALTEIAAMFILGDTRKIYADPTDVVDRIRAIAIAAIDKATGQ